jgi:hypothetical protein
MATVSRLLTVMQGNINNNHLYLRSIVDLFPADVFGGANSSQAAPRTIQVLWGDEAVDTDIDRTKSIFRRRGWMARFFKENCIQAGDQVVLEQLEPYVYRVSKAQHRSDEKVLLQVAARSAGRAIRDDIVRRDRFLCQSCGRRTKGQVHHILSRGQGGPDTSSNLVTLCGRCHMLVSPIPVEVLCDRLRISTDELLVQKARVEIAIHSWVLAQAKSQGAKADQPEEVPGFGVVLRAPKRSGLEKSSPTWKQTRPRSGKPWTREEDAALLREFDAGLPLEEIAQSRQRGVHAIEVRLCKLGRYGPGG